MKDRIIAFIESEGITAAEFADKIGVQRSSVSHVLNGRNNPGFAFIQKILEAYPSVNSRWLLMGDGDMYTSKLETENKQVEPKADLFSTTATPKKSQTETIPHNRKQVSDNVTDDGLDKASIPAGHPIAQEKKVVKVLIFYDDHTFEDFRPA